MAKQKEKERREPRKHVKAILGKSLRTRYEARAKAKLVEKAAESRWLFSQERLQRDNRTVVTKVVVVLRDRSRERIEMIAERVGKVKAEGLQLTEICSGVQRMSVGSLQVIQTAKGRHLQRLSVIHNAQAVSDKEREATAMAKITLSGQVKVARARVGSPLLHHGHQQSIAQISSVSMGDIKSDTKKEIKFARRIGFMKDLQGMRKGAKVVRKGAKVAKGKLARGQTAPHQHYQHLAVMKEDSRIFEMNLEQVTESLDKAETRVLGKVEVPEATAIRIPGSFQTVQEIILTMVTVMLGKVIDLARMIAVREVLHEISIGGGEKLWLQLEAVKADVHQDGTTKLSIADLQIGTNGIEKIGPA